MNFGMGNCSKTAVELKGKYSTGAKRRKIFNRCQAQENMQLALSAGKYATGAKRGKIFNRCQAQENMQPALSAGKYATGAKRGKIFNRCQAQGNMQPALSAGKYATGAKRGKTCNRCYARQTLNLYQARKNSSIKFCFSRRCFINGIISLAVTTEGSIDEGWDTEDVEIPDKDLLASDAKTLMDEVKAGHVEELQVPTKVS